ncbi:MAG: hypothetical protein AAGC63_02190 [Propionicimonas sp.]|nr:hypothetical protein [Propionicimonas sp.]
MGEISSDNLPPATLRERWAVLAIPALLVVGVSVYSGQLLCAVIELPIYARQRESPAIAVTIITAWWLTVASLAAVFT